MQSSLIDHGQVRHIKGIQLWSGSIWQGDLDANNSDIDRGRSVWSDREGLSAYINNQGGCHVYGKYLGNIDGDLTAASWGRGVYHCTDTASDNKAGE